MRHEAELLVWVAHAKDQESAAEVARLHRDTIDACCSALHQKLEGESNEREFTDAQLTAFKRRVHSGGSPACDDGVLGPFGSRIERNLKLKSVLVDSASKTRTAEVNGPCNLAV